MGRLFLSPGGEHAKWVLDMGTGTGVWAINYSGFLLASPSFPPANLSI